MELKVEAPVAQATGRARNMLLRRLIDVVALPSTALAPQDRNMAADVLLEVLFASTDTERRLCADRLRQSREAPRRILRYLSHCAIQVAAPILEENDALDSSDLCHIVKEGGADHRLAVARRKVVPSSVGDTIAECEDPAAAIALLENRRAELSVVALDAFLELSRDHAAICSALVKRIELSPSQALTMFWWGDAAVRAQILQRFAAGRDVIIDMCQDVFAVAAEEGWNDPVTRKTLQLIERRQRNRAAIDRSPYDSLEQAVETAAAFGMSPDLAQEIGYLSGVKPVTIAKIISDHGGEPIAVLCKATGLKRAFIDAFWAALRRPTEDAEGRLHPLLAQCRTTYETLSAARAQTTLRYWNWSLSSAFSPSATPKETEEKPSDDRFATPLRTARLVFGR
ncbi:MAG: DUF2336 domain-containing protein [Pseudomonadota bacterium]